jgi:hypothetical protein
LVENAQFFQRVDVSFDGAAADFNVFALHVAFDFPEILMPNLLSTVAAYIPADIQVGLETIFR